MSLCNLDKAVFQILLDRGFIEANHLSELVRGIESDFSARIEGRIEDRFNTINKAIKGISLEIKSVALKNSAGDWKYYHGVANTDGDLVARDHGNRLSLTELKLFFEIAVKILEEKYLSSADIRRLSSSKGSTSDTENLLQQLENDGWLKKNDSNYWVLGVRSYLELRPLLEEALLQPDEQIESQASADTDKGQARRIVEALPQIILY